VHGVGTHALIRFLVRRHSDSEGLIKASNSLRAVIWTAIALMTLHVIEIHLWALTYMLVLPGDHLDTYEKAIYFSFVTFTTLGYGDLTLSMQDWRILSGVEAMNRTLLAGWSTALLFVVVQHSWRNVGRDEAKH
jgi:voltage-gated potassium channel